MNTGSTIEVMLQAAYHLRRTAEEIEQKARALEQTGDFSLVGEAINAFSNLFNNVRLDLFVNRPVRECERRIMELEDTDA